MTPRSSLSETSRRQRPPPCRSRASGAGASAPARKSGSPRWATRRLSCRGAARRPADGRRGIENELADAAGGREGATAALYRLGTARERITMRSESASVLREQLRLELAQSETAAKRPGQSPAELEAAANQATSAARAAAHARDDLLARASLAQERLAALDARSRNARASHQPRVLADEGAELAVLLDVDSGNERAVAAALRGARPRSWPTTRRPGWRCSSEPAMPGSGVLPCSSAAAGGACRRASSSRSTLCFRPRSPRSPKKGSASTAARRALVRRRGRRGCPARARKQAPRSSARGLRAAGAGRAGRARGERDGDEAEEAEAAYAQVAHLRAARAADPDLLRRLVAGADWLDEALIAAVAVAARLQEPLRVRADAGAERAAALGTDLARSAGRARGAPGVDAREHALPPPSSSERGSAARARSGCCTSTNRSASRWSAKLAS